MSDFVDIIGSLANHIQNERVASYNEGVDMMLANVISFMALKGYVAGDAEHLPELLEQIDIQARKAARAQPVSKGE